MAALELRPTFSKDNTHASRLRFRVSQSRSLCVAPSLIGAQAPAAARWRRRHQGRRHLRQGMGREDRCPGRKGRAGPEQFQADRKGRRPRSEDRSRGDLLEPGQQGRRQLHGEGDVHRIQLHGPERSPASVRHRDRRQRPRHGHAELPLLLGLRQRHLHRPRHGPGAVRGQRAQAGSRTPPSRRPPARARRSRRRSRCP